MIGPESDGEPFLAAESLEDHVNKTITQYLEEMERERLAQLAAAQKRQPYQAEYAAHLELNHNSDQAHLLETFFSATHRRSLFGTLTKLPYKISPRKMRLFGIACCKQVPQCLESPELYSGILVAERMTLGTASKEEIESTRKSLRELRIARVETSNRWPITAVHDLFQYDQDYLGESGIYPHDPELENVLSAVSYAKYGTPNGSDVECFLLREILGNPFQSVTINPAWRSAEILALANEIFESENFQSMPRLAQLLQEAGCNDARILAHCIRTVGHVRGSWVLDLILEKEPDPFQLPFAWDFKCNHKFVDQTELKRRLEQFGLAGANPTLKVDSILAFAEWLEQQGDLDRANYIRTRCQLDDTPPSDQYVDLVEKLSESTLSLRRNCRIEFDNFYFGQNHELETWWDSKTIDHLRGLPTIVRAVSPSSDTATPVELLTQRIEALMNRTPVRGVDFEGHYGEQMIELLNSPSLSHLKYVKFETHTSKASPTSSMIALSQAKIARNLEYLGISNGVNTDEEAMLLASTPLDNLRRLDIENGTINCSKPAAHNLMSRAWFQGLTQLNCGFGDECATVGIKALTHMPNLHSLTLHATSEEGLKTIKAHTPFRSLRRLAILQSTLHKGCNSALSELRAPTLVDLWIEGRGATEVDLRKLLEAPLTANLLSLTIFSSSFDESCLQSLANQPNTARLRLLRFGCGKYQEQGNFNSLGNSALAGSVFPNLTTLVLESPYNSKATTDTARMLSLISAPNLRHLLLHGCGFDDECAKAIATNPSFSKLASLSITQRYQDKSLLNPAAAEQMLKSANLGQLQTLAIRYVKLQDSLSYLADTQVLPNLKSAGLSGTDISKDLQSLVHQKRPIVYIAS